MDVVEFLRARLDEDEHAATDGFSDGTPAHVLREVEAKRLILELHAKSEFCERIALDDVVDLLALPYSDHPDYQPEWHPDNWDAVYEGRPIS